MRYTSTVLVTLATLAISTNGQALPPSSSLTNDASAPPNIPPVTFAPTACSQCTIASIPKEPSCASLVPVDMQQLQAVFTSSSININALLVAVQNPAIKNCVCHWSTGTYNQTTNGAAATCLTAEPNVPGPVPSALGSAVGAAVAPCNATQATSTQSRFSMLGALIHCDAVVSHSTGRPADENPGATSGSGASVSKDGLQLVGGLVSIGAVVLAVLTTL